jgi:hypothetical protein
VRAIGNGPAVDVRISFVPFLPVKLAADADLSKPVKAETLPAMVAQ